ncbi:MAG: acyltransferase [Rhizobacter sp.]|nr:acyltransferase [Bacteriovorax sp.]
MNSEIKYRPDIDGLRAIAVIAVVLFHAFPAQISGGFVGVDVFFVISGYLISTIIFRQLSEERFSFKRFYIKRINRIFPALILVLISCYLFGWFTLFSYELKDLGKHIAGGSGFISNIILWEEFGYFDKASGLKPLLHLWSLAIEEQFYIIWPLVLYYSFKRKFNLLNVILFFAITSFLLNLFFVSFDAIGTFYALPTRFWELLVGSFLGYRTFHESTWKNTKACVGIVIILTSVFFFNQKQLYPGYRALLPTIGAALIILAGPLSWFNRKILSSPPLVWIGLISYPLYLWHWVIFSFLLIINSGEKLSSSVLWLAIVSSFVLSYLTNLFLEKPVKFNNENGKLAVGFFLLLFSIGLLGLYTFIFPPLRIHSVITDIENKRGQLKEIIYKDSCVPGIKSNSLDYCMLAQKTKVPTVALIGDSHANALYFGLSPLFSNMNENLLLMGKGTCVPFSNVESGMVGSPERCSKDINLAIDYALSSKEIKTIIITSRGPLYINGTGFHERRVDNYIKYNDEKNYADAFREGMGATMKRLVESQKKIILILDNPELSFNPELCLKPRPFSSLKIPKSPCDGKKDDEYKKRESAYRSIVTSVMKSFPSVKVLDPEKYFCDEQNCHAIIDGKLVYRDNNHLSRNGTVFLAEKIKAELYR